MPFSSRFGYTVPWFAKLWAEGQCSLFRPEYILLRLKAFEIPVRLYWKAEAPYYYYVRVAHLLLVYH